MNPLIAQSLATRHLDDLAFASRSASSHRPSRRPVAQRVGLALVDVGTRLSQPRKG